MWVEGIGLERDLPDPDLETPNVRSMLRAWPSANGSSRRALVSSSCISSLSWSCQLGGPTTIGMARDPEKETTRAKVMQNSVRAPFVLTPGDHVFGRKFRRN